MSRFRYITVLDFESGQVHLYDFDEMTMPDAEEVVSELHNLDYVQYMVHEYLPKLETKDLSFVADVIAENEALWLENEDYENWFWPIPNGGNTPNDCWRNRN